MKASTSPVRWLPLRRVADFGELRTPLQVDRSIATVRVGEATVACPLRGTIDASECMACERCVGVTSTARDGGVAIACTSGAPLPDSETMSARARASSVGSMMTSAVHTVRFDDPIERVVEMLFERGISGAPVVDGDGRPVGVVSKTDLLRLTRFSGALEEANHELAGGLSWASWAGLRACDVMVPIVLAITEEASVAQAAALMAYEGVHRLPVVRGDVIVGIVTSMDVLRWISRGADEPRQGGAS